MNLSLSTLWVPQLSAVGSLGSLTLWLCLLLVILGLGLSLWGALRSDPRLAEAGRRAAFGVVALSTVAVGLLEYAILSDDFSVRYVANHSMTVSPLWVKIVTLWAALEGSILLWAWVLSLYTALVAWRARNDLLRPWVMVAMYLSLVFFIGINLTIGNPFTAVVQPPTEGAGPNPLLQNHWMMAVHPILLYFGFVGLSVPFAYAFAALITGKLGNSWISQIRSWTLTAWAFLSAAIVAGGWWSYEVLGWGGYWAWDPVENASFIPWLLATAFLHSVQAQERKRSLGTWNIGLMVLAYGSTVLGTFLTRSGVVESVHAFSAGPTGPVFLGFFAFLVLLSSGLMAWRSPMLREVPAISGWFSREGSYLASNILFVVFAFMVVLGTLFPVFIELLQNHKTSVGAPFFNQFAIPLGWLLLALMGLGILIPWHRGEHSLWASVRWPVGLGLASMVLLAVFGIHGTVAVTVGLAVYNLIGIGQLTFYNLRPKRNTAPWKALDTLIRHNPRRYGAYVAHIGLLVIALGLAVSGAYKREIEVTLKPKQVQTVWNKPLVFTALERTNEPQRSSTAAQLRWGTEQLSPKLNVYRNMAQAVGMPSVKYHFFGDSYATLLAFDPQGEWVTIRLIDSPLVSWIWFGTFILLVGTAISLRAKPLHILNIREVTA